MRRFFPSFLIFAVLLIMSGCENSDTSSILEPSFGKVPRGCILSDTQNGVIDLIRDGIDLLFGERNAKKAANGHIDNVLREVCEGDYTAASQHLHSFIQQVEGQPEEKLTEYREDWANLVNWAIILATDPASITITIPPGAFEPTGNLGILDPANFTLWTANGEAAVETDPESSFDPFIMAISRIPDGQVAGVFGSAWNRPTAPPGYQILAENAFPPGGALVAVCLYESFLSSYLELPEDVDDDELPYILARLILAHGGANAVELLEVEDLPDGFVCPTDPTWYPGTQTLAAAPGWVQSIGRLAGNVAKKVFGLEPLHARRFAGRGLAGRTGSFSPFAPVDPFSLSLTAPDPWPGPFPRMIYVGDGVQLEATLEAEDPAVPPTAPEFGWTSSDEDVVTVDATGLVSGVGPGSAWIRVSYPGLRDSLEVAVIPRGGDLVVDLDLEEIPIPGGTAVPENGWMVQLYEGGSPVGDPMPTLSDGEVEYEDLEWGDYTVRLLTRDFDVTFPSAPDMSWPAPHFYSAETYPEPNTLSLDGVQEAVRETVKIHRLGEGGNGNAYEYMHGGKAWNAAFNAILNPESDLLGVQGQLVTIMSEPENEFVKSFFVTSPDLCPGIDLSTCDDMAWIGLNDNVEETFFFWVTGEALGSFHPWALDALGDSEHKEDYVEINALGLWSTVNGASSTNDGYFVEYEVPDPDGSGG